MSHLDQHIASFFMRLIFTFLRIDTICCSNMFSHFLHGLQDAIFRSDDAQLNAFNPNCTSQRPEHLNAYLGMDILCMLNKKYKRYRLHGPGFIMG